MRAWRVIDVQSTRQVFNVSKLVVPEFAGMPDYEQSGMFEEEWGRLLELKRLELEREKLRFARAQLKLTGRARRTGVQANHRLPINPKWHTWRGFVLDLQRLEARVEARVRVTKEHLAMLGPDSARTITRVMACYGLQARDWPPSTWNPDEERVYRPPKPPQT
jgi:hypothetical protein